MCYAIMYDITWQNNYRPTQFSSEKKIIVQHFQRICSRTVS